MTTTLQQQARALGDPTRHEIFRYVADAPMPVDVGRRAGRRRRLGSTDVFDPVAELADQMARQGFDPTVRQRGDDIDVTLRTCPFATTALADPDTVCGLHLGIAYGIADSVDGLVVDELIPKDPRRAHCRLHCHVESQTVRKDP